MNPQTKSKSDQVPLLLLEEKEQEILAKDETIQVSGARALQGFLFTLHGRKM